MSGSLRPSLRGVTAHLQSELEWLRGENIYSSKGTEFTVMKNLLGWAGSDWQRFVNRLSFSNLESGIWAANNISSSGYTEGEGLLILNTHC